MLSLQDDNDGLIGGINVTPLVDITLVLLIVFMVTAKLIVSQSVPLDLPKAASGESVQLVFGVDLNEDGDLRVNGESVSSDRAVLTLARDALQDDAKLRAVIRADHRVQHGRIIRVLDLLKQAGVTRVAFAVSPVPTEGSAGDQATDKASLTAVEPLEPRPKAQLEPSPQGDLGS